MGTGRNVEDEAWVSCRTKAQMKFLTLLKGTFDSKGTPKPQVPQVRAGEALPERLPRHKKP